MKIVFLGPPGAGKGTQATGLAKKLSIAHISTGEMLRGAVQAETDLGKQVASIMESGQLVPDELIVSIIGERIAEDDCKNGFILDGFPRTLAQAEALDGMLSDSSDEIDLVLLLDVETPDLIARLKNRLALEGRSDDSVETQKERLKVYFDQTEPLISYYEKAGSLSRIHGGGSIEDVTTEINAAVSGV